jgi:hypothetical protein
MAGQKASAVTGPTPGIVISLQPAASSRVARMTKRCRRSRLSSSASRTCSSGSITTARRAHSPWRSSAQSPGADRGMPPDQVRGRLLSISRSLPSRSARAVRSGRSSWESSDFTCAGRDPGSAGADPSASCKEYGRQTAEAHLGNGLRFGSTRSSTAWSGPPLATAGAPTARPTTPPTSARHGATATSVRPPGQCGRTPGPFPSEPSRAPLAHGPLSVPASRLRNRRQCGCCSSPARRRSRHHGSSRRLPRLRPTPAPRKNNRSWQPALPAEPFLVSRAGASAGRHLRSMLAESMETHRTRRRRAEAPLCPTARDRRIALARM